MAEPARSGGPTVGPLDERRLQTILRVQGTTENVIRAYDLKAEIALLCFVLSVEAANAIIGLERVAKAFPRLTLLLLVIFVAVVCSFIHVLWPSPIRSGGAYRARGLFFVDPDLSVDQYLDAFKDVDFEREAAHQALQLAAVARKKKERFVVSIVLAWVFYALLLILVFRA
jgi:hypothetical protein